MEGCMWRGGGVEGQHVAGCGVHVEGEGRMS